MNILEIGELVKTYDTGHRALDGLTLTVPEGSVFGFIGLNGAGKTTTIRILAGLTPRDSGTVQVMGRPVGGAGSEYKRAIGFVLDEPLYFDWMAPADYLRFVGVMYGVPEPDVRTRVEELLEFFELAERRNDQIRTFSTGMKKKISLAAAVIHQPKLIILDEPFEGIDALAANAIKEGLSMMASRGTTIMITSHVLDTVERFCTDVGIIHRGKLLLQSRTSEIRSRVRDTLEQTPYASLEELFVDLVSDRVRRRHLSWL